jgi:2-dehydro-3-deoxyphosphogluconate aldolase/(4S)-4-hydroxy-2-oxoglutarate aldolase
MIPKDNLPILAILRGITEKDVIPLAKLLVRNQIRHVEITMNTDDADRLIQQFRIAGKADLNVGAGTVLNMQDLRRALDAGAEFIVCPSLIKDVIAGCVSKNIPVFPGALTPTEIHTAWKLGATMVKLFPASLFGPGYIRAVKAPMNNIKLMAVGGVNPQNISKFFESGADAVAFGAGIIRSKWLEEGKYDLIEKHLRMLIEAYKSNQNHPGIFT